MKLRRILLITTASALLLLLGACATKPDYNTPCQADFSGNAWTLSDAEEQLGGNDPIEGFNRSMFCVNDVFMQYLVWPVSWVYGSILPEQVIRRIDMASDNLAFPGRMVSCFLQAKFKHGGTEFLRFLTNSTIGIAGFFDPADAWFNLKRRHESAPAVSSFAPALWRQIRATISDFSSTPRSTSKSSFRMPEPSAV